MVIDKVSVLIPTIGRVEILNSVLFSVFQQDFVDEVILLDEADVPVCESYQVNQALDLLSLKGVKVRVQRDRRRRGIGSARIRLAEMSLNEWAVMVDDDVVLGRDCIKFMIKAAEETMVPWVVPVCILVPKLQLDGYVDRVVKRSDPAVVRWVSEYPWFLPYFEYDSHFLEKLAVSGTQAILINRSVFLTSSSGISCFGRLPREDTYMTTKMGEGVFTSFVSCYHFEHNTQQNRSWDKEMFYRIHLGIMRNPDGFKDLMV